MGRTVRTGVGEVWDERSAEVLGTEIETVL